MLLTLLYLFQQSKYTALSLVGLIAINRHSPICLASNPFVGSWLDNYVNLLLCLTIDSLVLGFVLITFFVSVVLFASPFIVVTLCLRSIRYENFSMFVLMQGRH